MNVIDGLDQLDPPLPGCVLTVGNFDGVHVGHQALLSRCRELAAPLHQPVVALTFDPHPLAVVAPAKTPLRLMPVPERIHRLGDHGADVVVIASSEPRLLTMSAEQFALDVLVARFHPTHIVEGDTFGFGKGRKGSPQMLQELVRPFGCQVHVVEPVCVAAKDGAPLAVSSSVIRNLLRDGQVELAARCLGRPYAIESVVVHGSGRGRSLGFPTANLEMPDGQVVPGEGVYAGLTSWGTSQYVSAISIGRAETFGHGQRQFESHLVDFDGDLYGKFIRVEFLARIRPQQKFQSVADLTRQIQDDIASIRALSCRGPRAAQ